MHRGLRHGPASNILPTSSANDDDDSECSVFHPGSLICTHAETKADEASSTITVSMSVEVSKLEGGASMPELEELGWLAIKKAASERAMSLSKRLQSQSIPGDEDERHRTIVNILRHGVVVNVIKKNVNSFEHENYELILEDPKTRRRIKALCKPRIEGDGEVRGQGLIPCLQASAHCECLSPRDGIESQSRKLPTASTFSWAWTMFPQLSIGPFAM